MFNEEYVEEIIIILYFMYVIFIVNMMLVIEKDKICF